MINKNRLIRILSLSVAVMCAAQPSLANRENDFELFVGGKRYVSFKEYQIKRLKSTIKLEYISSSFQSFQEYRKYLLDGYDQNDYRGITREELAKVLDELDEQGASPSARNSLEDMREMQSMLKGRDVSTLKTSNISIDPDKLKTIVIEPSSP